jgi:hypothetical protein
MYRMLWIVREVTCSHQESTTVTSVRAPAKRREDVRINTTWPLIKKMMKRPIRLVMTARMTALITSRRKMMRTRRMSLSRRERPLRSKNVAKRKSVVS